MKHLYIFGLFLFGILKASPILAQTKLTGQVTDEKSINIEYASIFLLHARDSSQAGGTVTDAEGRFLLAAVQPGKYLLRSSFIGYQPNFQSFEVTESKADIPLRVILQPAFASLKEAVVIASRPTIIQKPDRMVMNLTNTVLATGYNAIEVLEKAPGIYIDPKSETISLNGKGALVIIDGKKTYLAAADLATFLKSIQSSDIQEVELIASPGAKYDAEGVGGIINIITKKGTQEGTKGTATIGGGFSGNSRQNAGLTLNHQRGNVALTGSYNLSNRHIITSNESRTDYLDEAGTVTNTHQMDNFSGADATTHNYRLAADWNLNKKTSFNAVLRGFNYHRTGIATATTKLLSQHNQPDSSLFSQTNKRNRSQQYAGTIGFKQRISPTKTLTADLDFATYTSEERNDILNEYGGNTDEQQNLYLRNLLPTDIRILAGQADYEQTLGKGKLEAGAKYSIVETGNNAKYEIQDGDNTWVNDAARTNDFVYSEQIAAAYITYSSKLAGFDYRLGLRTEYTDGKGKLLTTNQPSNRSYFNLFPSVLISRSFGNDHFVNAAFSRRISRPSYQSLNPFIYFQDVYTYTQGNPFLKPEFTSSIDVTYTLKNTYTAVLGYAETTNTTSYVTERISEQSVVTRTRAENLDSQTQYYLSLSVPVEVARWWSIHNSLYGSYLRNSLLSVASAPQQLQGFSGVYSVTNTFKVKGDWTPSLSAYFQSGAPYGAVSLKPQYIVNIGLQKKFMDGKFTFRGSYNDILKTSRAKSETNFSNLRSTGIYRWDSHFFNLSLSYNFGNQKVKTAAKDRRAASDEENRIN
ncbi:outer membrane beta-barrel protein [Pontibacter arcticus]|uniref:Outer membrane protein beta-barrel domain-containing protein n=1 Tax=Pontibacter arcticus TaxID=2080288 RepID=A0A364RIQ1_9BACT|nr:outer membrane beta-barrel protein [Pontibacter arcticus]RAU84106.1 hypothetical protein DP923_03395 [Pontibacter arcticus]